jgi:type IV fimbrial biogenesis protein FimT
MRRSMTGFTLMELMVVISIVAIMAAIAAPSFRDFINQNRLATVKTLLSNDINMARSEAIRSNVRYVVCPINAGGTDCDAGSNWASNGWWVCPASGVGCSSAANAVAVRPPVANGIGITGSAGGGVIFTPIGTATAAQTIFLNGATGTTPGSVSVALTGAVSTQ